MLATGHNPPLPTLSDQDVDLLHAFLCSGGSVPQFLQTSKLHIADFLDWSQRPAVRAYLDLFEELLGTFARLSALSHLPRAYEALARVAASDILVEARRAAMALLAQHRGATTRTRTTRRPPPDTAPDPDPRGRPKDPAPRPAAGRTTARDDTAAPHADRAPDHNGAAHAESADETPAPPAAATPDAARPASTGQPCHRSPLRAIGAPSVRTPIAPMAQRSAHRRRPPSLLLPTTANRAAARPPMLSTVPSASVARSPPLAARSR